MLKRITSLLVPIVALLTNSLTSASAPSFQLAFLHGRGELIACDSLSITSLEGISTQEINFPVSQTCNPPNWSPDGNYLVLSTPGLMVLDIAHSNLQVIIDPKIGPYVGITMWSPDSAYLVWNQHKGQDDIISWAIMDMKIHTIHEFESLSQMNITPAEVHYLNTLDGHTFLFRSGQQPQELRYPSSQLNCGWSASIRWDIAQLLCLDVDAKTYEDDISRLDSDTQTIVKLTDTPDLQEAYPEWSPDGTQIVYQVTEISSGKTWLQIMASDGSNVRRLTHPVADDVTPVFMVSSGNDVLPRWSSDGQYIAFQRHSGYKGLDAKVYVIKADGSDLQYIGDGIYPAWRPISQS